MKKIILVALMGISSLLFTSDENVSNPYLKRTDLNAAEWWRTSWDSSKEYRHLVKYEIEADVRLDRNPSKKIDSLMDFLKYNNYVVRLLRDNAVIKGNFSGSGSFNTFPVNSDKEDLYLMRCYQKVESNRSLYADIESAPMANLANVILKEGTISTMLTALGSRFIPTTVYSVVPYVANKIETITREEVFKNVKVKYGGFEICKGNPAFDYLVSKLNIKNIENMDGVAMLLSKEFYNTNYFINVKKSKVQARNISDTKEVILLASIVKENNYFKCGDIFNKLEKANETVLSVFEKESFFINDKVFDSKSRKIGDVWDVDSGFFNSFLHPDLRGRFEGRVCLKYDRDNVDNERVIKVVKSSNNAITSLEYVEPDFRATYDEKNSSCYLFIDLKTGILKRATFNIRTSQESNLPDMVLTRGLCSAGNIVFKITYEVSVADRNKNK